MRRRVGCVLCRRHGAPGLHEARLVGRAAEMNGGGFGDATFRFQRLPFGSRQICSGCRHGPESGEGRGESVRHFVELLDEHLRGIDRAPSLESSYGKPAMVAE